MLSPHRLVAVLLVLSTASLTTASPVQVARGTDIQQIPAVDTNGHSLYVDHGVSGQLKRDTLADTPSDFEAEKKELQDKLDKILNKIKENPLIVSPNTLQDLKNMWGGFKGDDLEELRDVFIETVRNFLDAYIPRFWLRLIICPGLTPWFGSRICPL